MLVHWCSYWRQSVIQKPELAYHGGHAKSLRDRHLCNWQDSGSFRWGQPNPLFWLWRWYSPRLRSGSRFTSSVDLQFSSGFPSLLQPRLTIKRCSAFTAIIHLATDSKKFWPATNRLFRIWNFQVSYPFSSSCASPFALDFSIIEMLCRSASGPTSYAPVVEAAVDIVERSRGQFHVLVIIADGQVDFTIHFLLPLSKKAYATIHQNSSLLSKKD